jgi:hypothetical protein
MLPIEASMRSPVGSPTSAGVRAAPERGTSASEAAERPMVDISRSEDMVRLCVEYHSGSHLFLPIRV